MIADHLTGIEQFEADLWKVADNLRANSNLASNEYFKAVKPKSLKAEVITPVFKDYHKGSYQVIGFFAKKARGIMARYLIDNEIDNPADLTGFAAEGYAYNAALSNTHEWVFTRRQ